MNTPKTDKLFRAQLVKEVAQIVCRPCTDPRMYNFELNFEDPIACECRCQTVELMLERITNDIEPSG